jgi:hypothetical protein
MVVPKKLREVPPVTSAGLRWRHAITDAMSSIVLQGLQLFLLQPLEDIYF